MGVFSRLSDAAKTRREYHRRERIVLIQPGLLTRLQEAGRRWMRRRTDADSWRQQIDEATADVSLGELPAHLNIAQQSHVLLGIASARESARRARTAIPGAGGR